MKKIITMSIILLILLIATIPITYSVSVNDNNEQQFFTVNKNKISNGETLEMIID